MTIRLRYIALFLLLAMVVPAICMTLWFSNAVQHKNGISTATTIYIPPGSSIKRIGRQLEKTGTIKKEWIFSLAARLQGDNGGLKAGEYQLTAHASINDIISLLQSGQSYQRQITLAEGLTSTEIVAIINNDKNLTGTIDIRPPEGSLLPETYSYARNHTRQSIIDRMQKSMQETVKTLWDNREENLPLSTPQEALVLASIVEKETGITSERKRVAGVFINRLRRKMLLQSDPTVIYAVTNGTRKLGRALTYKDLKKLSPYNTYTSAGLPPHPIANPGYKAIAAALQPEKHNFIYFVANGTGGHTFAKNLAAHNRNVGKWRKIIRKRRHAQRRQ